MSEIPKADFKVAKVTVRKKKNLTSETLVQAFLMDFLDKRLFAHMHNLFGLLFCILKFPLFCLFPLISSGVKTKYDNNVHFAMFFIFYFYGVCALNLHTHGYKPS